MFQPMPLCAPGWLPTPNFLRSSSVAWKKDRANRMDLRGQVPGAKARGREGA